ncbi:DUF2946 family protein [Azospirillum sp. B506]|uniref:DUF2946 family protein n=1 Tax=Azospirillum sp. B506 TaxID=137721 RepID=UPI001FCADBAF|nr:DUF2946 family protein [Azospirillum sp. B506]
MTVRQVRRLGLVAGMAALLLQVVAWSWMPLPTGPIGAARTGETVSLPICSSGGLTTIQADAADYGVGASGVAHDDDHGRSQDPAHSGTGHCPLCPLVAGLALPPPQPPLGPTAAMARDTGLLPAERIAAGWFLSTLQARAPPHPV